MNLTLTPYSGTPSDVASCPMRLTLTSIVLGGAETPISRVNQPPAVSPPSPTAREPDADAVACLTALGMRKPEAVKWVTEAEKAGVSGSSQIVTWVLQRRPK